MSDFTPTWLDEPYPLDHTITWREHLSQKQEHDERGSMNSLPGNGHAAVSKFRTEGLHEWQEREGETDATCIALALDANTEATLALAFEQRTANLIAMAAQCTANGRKELGHPLIEEAGERLGMTEEP